MHFFQKDRRKLRLIEMPYAIKRISQGLLDLMKITYNKGGSSFQQMRSYRPRVFLGNNNRQNQPTNRQEASQGSNTSNNSTVDMTVRQANPSDFRYQFQNMDKIIMPFCLSCCAVSEAKHQSCSLLQVGDFIDQAVINV